jgi:dipeptide/tripeptide permease
MITTTIIIHTIKAYFAILGIAVLIAGWLADTLIGRYKVMRSSIWIMWIAAVIATMSSVVAHLYESYGVIHSYLVAVAFLAMAVGLGGFQATIFQFGLDQLHD